MCVCDATLYNYVDQICLAGAGLWQQSDLLSTCQYESLRSSIRGCVTCYDAVIGDNNAQSPGGRCNAKVSFLQVVKGTARRNGEVR